MRRPVLAGTNAAMSSAELVTTIVLWSAPVAPAGALVAAVSGCVGFGVSVEQPAAPTANSVTASTRGKPELRARSCNTGRRSRMGVFSDWEGSPMYSQLSVKPAHAETDQRPLMKNSAPGAG